MMQERTTTLQSGSKGRPLVMLAMLISVWMGSRLIMWDSPFPPTEVIAEGAAQLLASQAGAAPDTPASVAGRDTQSSGTYSTQERAILWSDTAPALASPDGAAPLLWEDRPVSELAPRGETAAAHQLIWLAAMAYLPVPQAIEQRMGEPVRVVKPAVAITGSGSDRWSLDAWALWREGSNSALSSAGRAPTYGASQAGAVLNYRLAPQTRRDPRAYVRIYRALIDNGESEIAAGASARLFANLPLRAHAELRVTEFADSTEVRPAAFVTTELPRASLPLGLYAEAYAQAGYVAGEAETAFADGQLHVLRDVTRFDLGKVSVGAAAWGGAQEDAQRVDLGPSVRADLQIGEVPARVSLDYRARVAGDAEPQSGVAVTLSTRF